MAAKKFIYLFGGGKADGKAEMKDLLGGKGANLAEMTNIGAPVPPGFTISTEACRYYDQNAHKFPPTLEAEIDKSLKKLQHLTGKEFGSSTNPLLLSVRSGAKFSMPGMMDTILNLGLNDDTVKVLLGKTRNARFAHDTYRRFISMFGDVVLGIEKKEFEDILQTFKRRLGVKDDTELTADTLKDIVEEYKTLVKEKTGKHFPQEPRRQLLMSIEAVFKSWNNPRAITYRNIYRIQHDLGTAVNVQVMVFGNTGENSATGVGFTRDPGTGENRFYGEYLTNAQGEDVVAGIRTPKPICELEKQMPEVYRKLTMITGRLEKHYRDIQDFEFTVEDGKLYMLQTRSGKRTGLAAIKIAVDMVAEKLISKEEAIMRVDPDALAQYLFPIFDTKEEGRLKPLAKGLPAGPGAASGKVVLSANRAVEQGSRGEKIVLVRTETSADDIHGMKASQGFLTTTGGMTCIAGDTRILTNQGMMTAENCFDLLEKSGALRILSFDSRTLRPVWRPIIATGCRPAEVITIAVSQTGRAEHNILRLTADHKMFTIKNRRQTKKRLDAILDDEDFLTVVDQIPPLDETDTMPDLAYIAGAILSDGYINLKPTKGSVTFIQKPTPEKTEFIAAVQQAFEQAFGVPFSYVRERKTESTLEGRQIHGNVEDRICYHRGPAEHLAKIRDDISAWVLKLDRTALLNFLAGYVDGDGTYAKESSAVRLQIVVSENKPAVVEGLALACLRLGIVPQITNNRDHYAVQLAEHVEEILAFTHRIKAELPPRQYESKCFALRALFEDVVDDVNFMGRIREGIKRNIMFGVEKIRRDVLPLCSGAVYQEVQELLDSPLRSYRAVRLSGRGKTQVYNFEVEAANELDKNFVIFTSRMTPVIVSNSHAAVVARQMGKVCVAGAGDVQVDERNKTVKIGKVTIKEGDSIAINGFTGAVYALDIPREVPSEVIQVLQGKKRPEESPTFRYFSTFLKWTDEFRRLKVRANADTPEQAREALELGGEGIGLCRTEHMFFAKDRVPIMQKMIMAETPEEREKYLALLLPMQKDDFLGIFKEMDGRPVTIRLLDPPLHEFLPKKENLLLEIDRLERAGENSRDLLNEKRRILRRVEGLHEFNPMLGLRGCRLGILMPEISRMQTRAIIEAAIQASQEGIKVIPEIMVPLVGMASEMRAQKELIAAVLDEVMKKSKKKIRCSIGTMIELPRAAITADEIAKEAEFFSFGTNDLTQTTFGFSRDDTGRIIQNYISESHILREDPFATLDEIGVGFLMRIGVEKGRAVRKDLKVGICGEHGGDPASVEFCHRVGLNYVSCAPKRIPIARLAAARAALREKRQKKAKSG